MRISIVTGPWLPVPALQGGSVPRMWHGLAEEFARRGHDVVLMPRVSPDQPKSELRNGVRYERVGGFAQGRSTYLDLAKDLVYAVQVLRHLPAADILVLNDFWLPVLTGWFSRGTGLTVVSANRFPKGQYRFYPHVARVIAASRAIKKAIIEQTPAIASRVRCIPNPLDTSQFVPPSTSRKKPAGKKILYVGRVHPEKGVHLLVAAFGQITGKHAGTTLQVVGPTQPKQGGGGQKYLRELTRLADGFPVTFAPPEFDVSKLAAIYQGADLFCYPTMAEKGEALPVAPLEAMSTGLPVIVSSLECFSDFLRPSENGLQFNHRTNDPAGELARALENALSDWDRTRELGRRGIITAQAFSFPGIANKFLEEFERLLGAEM
jgi:glycosyltransferase involved in cell wall biosynthesis